MARDLIKDLRRWSPRTANAPFRNELVERLALPPNVSKHAVAEYLAASAAAHLWDGWRYLARSVQALSSGDAAAAIHLGYYAELRAAMSMLGTRGIGVLDQQHLASGAADVHVWGKSGTHKAAWLLLNAWGATPASMDPLLDALSVGGQTFRDWLEKLAPPGLLTASATSEIAADWVKAWSIDLAHFTMDRDTRNRASYRPSRLDGGRSFDAVRDGVDVLVAIWDALAPEGPGGVTLDSYLLSLSAQRLNNRHGLGFGDLPPVIERLCENGALPLLLTLANDHSNPDAAAPVVCRALLLLRLAALLTRRMMTDAGISRPDVDPWLTFNARNFGLTDFNQSLPEPLSDIFDDVLGDIEDLRTDTPPQWVRQYLAGTFSRPSVVQVDRATLWLLEV